jgi:16S rRNA processing protein RimM
VATPVRIELGRIVGAHALRGEVRVRFFGDGPDNLMCAPEVWLADSRDDPAPRGYRILRTGDGRKGEMRLALEGITSRSAAEALRGSLVLGDEAALLPLEDDAYYWHELIGFHVESATGEAIGDVQELWETGSHDVLVVRTADERQVLIPTAREIMLEIDQPGRRIVVDAIPGLLDE